MADLMKWISKGYHSRTVELLEQFNNNVQNSKVVEYVSRQNLFDMIGKSRHEMVHSRMIAELLGGRYFDISNKMTLIRFFDIVIMRAKEQGVDIPQEFVDAVLTRSLSVDSVADKQTEYPLNSYLEDYGKKVNANFDKKQRLDVFLRYNLTSTLKKKGNRIVEVFIENKVLSKEHDNQTQHYYESCADGRKALQLFVYLSPISKRELSNYGSVSENMKPAGKDNYGKPVYVHICYQDIFDKVIAPLMEEQNMNQRDTVILGEYANCLELPAMPDADDEDLKLGAKELSIMAIGNTEKQMLSEFMGNIENVRLLEAAVSHHIGRKLYSFDGTDCLSFDQALQDALRYYTKKHSEKKSMLDFKDIIGAQKGGARFLIYVVKETEDKLFYIPTHLFEYNKRAYKTIAEALKDAIKDYISRTGKTTNEVIKEFECLYARVKYHQHVLRDSDKPLPGPGVHYLPTAFTGLYVREDIPQDKIPKINEILGNGFDIKPITEECYHDLLLSGDGMLWESYDKRLFNALSGTPYYYRKGTEDRLEAINAVLPIPIEESPLSESDRNLLEQFYKNNSKLILSIYRILLENEQDADTYEERKKEYKKLLK